MELKIIPHWKWMTPKIGNLQVARQIQTGIESHFYFKIIKVFLFLDRPIKHNY